MRRLIPVHHLMEEIMKNKLEIVDKYEKLLKIKKMIVILGAFTGMTLFIGMLSIKFHHAASARIFIGMSIVSTVVTCLLWTSIKPIKKHILTLMDGK